MTDGKVDAGRQLVAERARQLGMSPAAMVELSESSPDAFAALLNVQGTAPDSGSVLDLGGSVNTDALGLGGGPAMEIDGFKTKAWFDAQRKEMGHVKFLNDGNIQRELSKSMNGFGERFNAN